MPASEQAKPREGPFDGSNTVARSRPELLSRLLEIMERGPDGSIDRFCLARASPQLCGRGAKCAAYLSRSAMIQERPKGAFL